MSLTDRQRAALTQIGAGVAEWVAASQERHGEPPVMLSAWAVAYEGLRIDADGDECEHTNFTASDTTTTAHAFGLFNTVQLQQTAAMARGHTDPRD